MDTLESNVDSICSHIKEEGGLKINGLTEVHEILRRECIPYLGVQVQRRVAHEAIVSEAT